MQLFIVARRGKGKGRKKNKAINEHHSKLNANSLHTDLAGNDV
jgi:hypothetical protein